MGPLAGHGPDGTDDSQEGSSMAITVYPKPNCVQCNATYRALDKAGLSYQTVDISLDVEALEQVRALEIGSES